MRNDLPESNEIDREKFNNSLAGGAENGTLFGGEGNGGRDGRTGGDVLICGAGDAELIGDTGTDGLMTRTGDGAHVIGDFETGAGTVTFIGLHAGAVTAEAVDF